MACKAHAWGPALHRMWRYPDPKRNPVAQRPVNMLYADVDMLLRHGYEASLVLPAENMTRNTAKLLFVRPIVILPCSICILGSKLSCASQSTRRSSGARDCRRK